MRQAHIVEKPVCLVGDAYIGEVLPAMVALFEDRRDFIESGSVLFVDLLPVSSFANANDIVWLAVPSVLSATAPVPLRLGPT